MSQILFRFVVGGVVVSVFALIGDLFKPKSFAGLFGSAPSVALATLGLHRRERGSALSATEARSMMAGAVAFVAYASLASWIMMGCNPKALWVTACAIPLWLGTAFGLWYVCITAIAGVIAKEYGPVVGGLFLAFPAIFPASATLIEKHQKEKKEEHGGDGTERGREAASVDAAGSAMGSIGLLIFALLVWQFMPSHKTWLVLTVATLCWLTVSVLTWQIRKRA